MPSHWTSDIRNTSSRRSAESSVSTIVARTQRRKVYRRDWQSAAVNYLRFAEAFGKNGQLPPGLQKRLEPLPCALGARLLSIPEYWERVIVERNVILIDRRTNRILDIIENVVGLATGH
jgi:hypothetical protein